MMIVAFPKMSLTPFVLLLTVIATLSMNQANGATRVVTLDEDNWEKIMQGEWMVEFFAPWCPACRALHPTWQEFAEWTDDLELEGVAQVDVTENPGLSGRFMVTALPTIYHVKDGEFRQYRGPREKDSFISFVEGKKYTNLETIPSWKHPNSMQMTLVSYFFKMSMALRNVHQMITEDYGYPYWASYALFASGTIILGAFLGLIIVCCVDVIFPYKAEKPKSYTVSQKKKNDDIKEEDDEKESDNDDNDESASNDEGSDEAEKTNVVRKRRAKKAD